MNSVRYAPQAVVAFIHPAAGGCIELRRSILRGRRPVRADRRLGTDEKRIRAQSTISYERNPQADVAFAITVFSVRMRFSSVQKTRLARAARRFLSHATVHETPYLASPPEFIIFRANKWQPKKVR